MEPAKQQRRNMILGQISILTILSIVIYSITGMVPLIAALYLLLRRGNAFAPDITPPVRLRRWAASFFAIAALRHFWWLLFYVLACDIRSVDDTLHSAGYVTFVMLDYVTILSTIAGTLLAVLVTECITLGVILLTNRRIISR